MDFEDRVGLEPAEASALRTALAQLGSLHALIQWGLRREPPLVIADVVVQDEFSHDVLIPYRDGLFLAFDTT
jgi:hypothetical protein